MRILSQAARYVPPCGYPGLSRLSPTCPARYLRYNKCNSRQAAKMRAEREAAKPHVSPPPKKPQTRQTPPPTLRHRPSLRQPPRLSYEHQPRGVGNRTRNEREHMNLPLALRKPRREAAVKGCRKVGGLSTPISSVFFFFFFSLFEGGRRGGGYSILWTVPTIYV